MPSYRRDTVAEILSERGGLQKVRLNSGDRAQVLTQLVGAVAVGDDVIVNTTAVERSLGTGGWHLVHWNLSRDEWHSPGGGHIMKLRYTSLQVDTGSEHEHRTLGAETLEGTPVVVCGLHSQVGVVAAVLRRLLPSARIAYVMTDGAALPMALSDLVATLLDAGALDRTITAGHAFGGQFEAVTVADGLLLAADDGADVVIVGMGPGVVGTGTRLGTTSTETASICDTVDALDGRAVLCLRASDSDERDRHRGVSHHSRTALELARTQPLTFTPDHEAELPDAGEAMAALRLNITTMGRDHTQDPAFFEHAAAAAQGAADLLP